MAGAVYETANSVTGYFHLKAINDDLAQKNVELELQMERLLEKLTELTHDSSGIERMRKESLSGYDIFKAKVVNNTLTHADNYITLDKGEKDGIRSEMGVVDGNGVVGIVYMTSDHYSVVIPVLNSKSSISCKIKNSDYFGFLKWDGGASNYATVKDMPRHSLFSLGDTIVTSGLTPVFPCGLLVGTITQTNLTDHDNYHHITLQIATDYRKINYVQVIHNRAIHSIDNTENNTLWSGSEK
jgi:rod shape-determining protein MreC